MKCKCWNCNKEIDRYSQGRNYCNECLEKKRIEEKEINRNYQRCKDLIMIENAIKVIEKDDGNDLDFYKEAVMTVKEFCEEKPGIFDSKYECIAAIVLISHCVKIKCQYKVLNYRADFLIPGFKIVLEIDGALHKGKVHKDSKRDMLILNELGQEWEIVRIPTDEIDKHPKRLYDYMLDIRLTKRKYREEHKNEMSLEMNRIIQNEELIKKNKEIVKQRDNNPHSVRYLREK